MEKTLLVLVIIPDSKILLTSTKWLLVKYYYSFLEWWASFKASSNKDNIIYNHLEILLFIIII